MARKPAIQPLRASFPGFYRPTDADFVKLWKEAKFVLDTNVLLNIYRYPTEAREQLFTALGQVADRLWIPYQAVLEFQRGRLKVIKEQKETFRSVRDIVSDAHKKLSEQLAQLKLSERHSLIDASSLTKEVEDACQKFLVNLTALEDQQVEVHQEDPLREKIDGLLAGRVGEPLSQQRIMEIDAEGLSRAKSNLPPALEDAGKADGKEPVYSYGGRSYQARFGDLYLWMETLAYCKKEGVESVVIITDDRKSDWWQVIESGGKKTIGPRPELVDEAAREAGVKLFYMYGTAQFLTYAKQYLQAEVSDQSIEQVREVAASNDEKRRDVARFALRAETAVLRWATKNYPDITFSDSQHFDWIVDEPATGRRGIDVLAVSNVDILKSRLHGRLEKLVNGMEWAKTNCATLAVVLDPSMKYTNYKTLNFMDLLPIPDGITVVIGVLVEQGSGGQGEFAILRELIGSGAA
jgi:hypothetical protein